MKQNHTLTNNPRSISILTIDDHPLFSNGISLLLDSSKLQYECNSANDIKSALKIVTQEKPDLILLDLNLNLQPWKQNILEVQKVNYKNSPLAIISSSEDKKTIREVLSCNVQGFIPKSSSTDILLAAINLVLAGGVFVPPQLASNQVVDIRMASAINSRLSGRQKEILQQAVEGKANKVIANELNLSESTIKSHLSSAYKILDVKNRSQAMQLCKDIYLFKE